MANIPAYEGKDPYIFISYAHKNNETVLPIIDALNERGYRVWYDKGIEAGTEWPEYIANRLRGAGCVVVFISTAAVHSQNCRREINYAISIDQPMLVIHLENTELLYGLDMQLGTVQAMFWERHADFDSFADELSKCPLLASCHQSAERVPFDEAVENDPALKNAYLLLSDGDFAAADKALDAIALQMPNNPYVWLGKLMAECKVSEKTHLSKAKFRFDQSENYKKIFRYGTPTLKTELAGYITELYDRLEGQKSEKVYREALTLMERAATEGEYRAAAMRFSSIMGHRDAALKVDECLQKAADLAKLQIYNEALALYRRAVKPTDFHNAALLFQKIPGYLDADSYFQTCQSKSGTVGKTAETKIGENSDKTRNIMLLRQKHTALTKELEMKQNAERMAGEAFKKQKILAGVNLALLVFFWLFLLTLISAMIDGYGAPGRLWFYLILGIASHFSTPFSVITAKNKPKTVGNYVVWYFGNKYSLGIVGMKACFKLLKQKQAPQSYTDNKALLKEIKEIERQLKLLGATVNK